MRARLAGLATAAWLWPVAALGGLTDRPELATAVNAPAAREAVTRVAFAEAAGQGDSGLAGVVFTILNRLESGAWGASIEAVVNARGQFEPVMRVGGDWRALPTASPAQRARIDTILNLALEGRLPDPTGGARYFQNPVIVARRAMAGKVSPKLVHFGGATPSAVIGDHSFYVSTGAGPTRRAAAPDPHVAAGGDIFPTPSRNGPSTRAEPRAIGERGLFILSNGEIVADPGAASPPP